jgi:hypothetical protein
MEPDALTTSASRVPVNTNVIAAQCAIAARAKNNQGARRGLYLGITVLTRT